MRQETAHVLAIRALGWLVSQETLIDGFLAHTGASQDDLRAQAGDPDFLCGVLDYVLLNDQWGARLRCRSGSAPRGSARRAHGSGAW